MIDSFHGIGLTLLRAEPVIGRCYVLTYSPSHDYNMSDMTPGEVLGIVKSWTQVYTRHLSSNNPLRKSANIRGTHDKGSEDSTASTTMNLRYMQIFDNNGELVGCSNSHPHGQIWITSSMPDVPKLELSQMRKYRLENCGRHLLEEYVQLEMEQKERIIWQNDGFLAVCPWWAVWPFEVLLLPKRQVRALVDFNKTERLQFSEAILQIVRSYDNLFETTFPYSMYFASYVEKFQLTRPVSAIHQAPLDATNDELESSYLHMHFSPPLLLPSVKKFFGGYELYGEPTREITPETAASYLRHSASQLSAKSDG
jgi:UDPglucose--hexose-1-phosphate uridylyltransferase